VLHFSNHAKDVTKISPDSLQQCTDLEVLLTILVSVENINMRKIIKTFAPGPVIFKAKARITCRNSQIETQFKNLRFEFWNRVIFGLDMALQLFMLAAWKKAYGCHAWVRKSVPIGGNCRLQSLDA